MMKTANPLTLALNNHQLTCAHVLVWAGCNTKVLHKWACSVCNDCLEVRSNQYHYAWLQDYICNVMSLQHLTRYVIRRCLASELSVHITQLPLPIALQGYVMMNDLYHECELESFIEDEKMTDFNQ